MSNQTFRLHFRPNSQREKDGKQPIYIRIFVDGAKTELATTHYINPKHWDAKGQRLKSNAPNVQLINGFIDLTKNRIQQIFLDCASRGIEVKPVQLKNKFLGKDDPNRRTICEAFDYTTRKWRRR